MTRDPLVHGRRTVLGLDLTYGRTTLTPCGKTRNRIISTSTDPAAVSCAECRRWHALQEREMETTALAAAEISRSTGITLGATPEELAEQARRHAKNAAAWEEF